MSTIPYTAPECRVADAQNWPEAHTYCHGPGVTTVGDTVAIRWKCDCDCHAQPEKDRR